MTVWVAWRVAYDDLPDDFTVIGVASTLEKAHSLTGAYRQTEYESQCKRIQRLRDSHTVHPNPPVGYPSVETLYPMPDEPARLGWKQDQQDEWRPGTAPSDTNEVTMMPIEGRYTATSDGIEYSIASTEIDMLLDDPC